jgi:hypothetical protein
LGRLEEAEKAARLTKYDGSSWTNRVTEPRAPALGKKPDMSKVTSLRRPLVSKTTAASRNARGAFGSGGTAAGHSLSNSVGTASVALSAGAAAAAARRRFAQTPSDERNGETAGGAPPASPLAARLASGSAGYYRDVHARTKAFDPFGIASSRQTSPETETRGPPGWSDGGGGFGGAGAAARRAVFKSADVFEKFSQENAASGGSGNESDRNFHDDFGEFRSEGEYDSEFE